VVRRCRYTLLFAGVALATGSCSSSRSSNQVAPSPPAPVAESPWAGTYTCTNTLTTTLSSTGATATTSGSDTLVVSVSDNTLTALVWDVGVDGGLMGLCTGFAATVNGAAAATLGPFPQGTTTCVLADPFAAADAGCDVSPFLTVDFTGGTLAFDGRSLTATLSYTAQFAGDWLDCNKRLADDSFLSEADASVVGSGTEVSTCSPQ
jgi:hypothetical protein